MRYIIAKYVEAANVQEALRKAKRTDVMEVYLQNDVWKERGYSLDSKLPQKRIGFDNNN